MHIDLTVIYFEEEKTSLFLEYRENSFDLIWDFSYFYTLAIQIQLSFLEFKTSNKDFDFRNLKLILNFIIDLLPVLVTFTSLIEPSHHITLIRYSICLD